VTNLNLNPNPDPIPDPDSQYDEKGKKRERIPRKEESSAQNSFLQRMLLRFKAMELF
jgi:hypothetical protein